MYLVFNFNKTDTENIFKKFSTMGQKIFLVWKCSRELWWTEDSVWTKGCGSRYANAYVSTWRHQKSMPLVFLIHSASHFSEKRSLINSARRVRATELKDCPFVMFPAMGLQERNTSLHSAFYMGAEDPNSGPGVCTAGSPPTESCHWAAQTVL